MRHIISFFVPKDVFLILIDGPLNISPGKDSIWTTIEKEDITEFREGREYFAWAYEEDVGETLIWEKNSDGKWTHHTSGFNLEEIRHLAQQELITITEELVEELSVKRPWPDEGD